MSDFVNGSTFSPGIGTPFFGRRQDAPTDQATANGNVGVVQFDAYGSMRTSQEGGYPTYWATSQFSCDSTATDIAIFAGNTSAIIKILGIFISSFATSAAHGDITVIRRSAVNTAGTAANASVAKADPRDGAANGAPQHYTAHPTGLGTSAGTLFAAHYYQPQAAASGAPAQLFIDPCQLYGAKPWVLKALATDIIVINAAAALGGSGNVWDITWAWVELPTTG